MSSHQHTRRFSLLALPPLILAGLAGIPLAGTVSSAEDPPEWRRRGENAPGAAWDALEGQPAPSLAVLSAWEHVPPLDWPDLGGNVVLLVHYEAWQRNAEEEFDHLAGLNVAHHADGLVVLAVHSSRNPHAREVFHETHFVPLPLAVDAGSSLAEATAVKRYPTYHIVGRDGRVRVAGVTSKRDEAGVRYLDHALAAVLAEPFEGERKEIELDLPHSRVVERASRDLRHAGGVAEREEKAPLVLGEDGWPRVVDKPLHARLDLRGKRAPEFVAQRWFGDTPDVTDKVWLAYLFSTADGFSLSFMPRLQRMHEKFGEDLVVAAVSPQAPDAHVGNRRPWANTLEDFFAAFPEYRFHKGYDGEQRLQESIQVAGLPYAILVDSGGTVRWQGYPFDPKDPLTKKLVGAVIERDARRRAEEEARRKKAEEDDEDGR